MTQPGEEYEAYIGYEKLGEIEAEKRAKKEHFWIIIATYGLTDQQAAEAKEGVSQTLGLDGLVALTGIGCYICEQPYQDVVGKPCAG